MNYKFLSDFFLSHRLCILLRLYIETGAVSRGGGVVLYFAMSPAVHLTRKPATMEVFFICQIQNIEYTVINVIDLMIISPSLSYQPDNLDSAKPS